MKEKDICIKAAKYTEFLILHLGLEDASLYVDVMQRHIKSKIDVFRPLCSDCIDAFNEIKQTDNLNGQTRFE